MDYSIQVMSTTLETVLHVARRANYCSKSPRKAMLENHLASAMHASWATYCPSSMNVEPVRRHRQYTTPCIAIKQILTTSELCSGHANLQVVVGNFRLGGLKRIKLRTYSVQLNLARITLPISNPKAFLFQSHLVNTATYLLEKCPNVGVIITCVLSYLKKSAITL
jgi:hypothetical protein